MIHLTLQLSAFADPIARQLRKQKFRYDPMVVKQHQHSLNAIETLYFNDLVPDATKLKEKLYRQVLRHVKRMNKRNRLD